MTATKKLHDLGQSLWLDNITRDLLNTGTLKRYIDELSVTGLTSNPTIFDHAIKNSTAYDGAIRQKRKNLKSSEELFFELALDDITHAADLFRPIWDKTNGVDGWVSLEVSPLLAHDTASTLAAARDLHARAGRPNLFIKIPGTKEGLPAIEEAIFAGVPVNVTLLFSREHYVAAAEAFLRGIERRIEPGSTPRSGSVASVFVSRWDAAVMERVPEPLRDRLGIAIAGRIYKSYRDLLELATLAASVQRRRPAATAPVGQHRNQRPQGLRRALHQGTGRAVHREHHARGHLEGFRRPRRHRPDSAGRWRRLRGRPGSVRQGRYRPRRPGRPAPGRRGEVVREVLERTDGGDRVQERRSREGQLRSSP